MPLAQIVEVQNPDEIKDVESLANAIWPQYYSPIIGESQVNYMLTHFQSAKAISDQIEEGYRYFLMRMNNINVGYFAIFLFKKKGEIFISKLYIKSDQRGQGLGRQALDFIEGLSRSNRIAEITLMVNKKNFSARQFYEQGGFINTAPILKDIGGGFLLDDYLYSKKLSSLWTVTRHTRKAKTHLISDEPARMYYLATLTVAIIMAWIIFFPKPKATALYPQKIDSSHTPYQSEIIHPDVRTKNLLGGNFVLNSVASYKISGLLLDKYYSLPLSGWDLLSTFDLLIAWGDLALPENSKYVKVEHSRRNHQLQLINGALFDNNYLNQHASFNHIIPANNNIRDAIAFLRKGKTILLEGFLVNAVNISVPDQQVWATSKRRNDTGIDSCEIVYVTKLIVDGKMYE